MEAQRQPFVLDPGAWNWPKEPLKATSELFEERTACLRRRMSVSQSGALELQTVVANVDQTRQPNVPFEINKSPAAHQRDPRPLPVGQLCEEMLGSGWKAGLHRMLDDRGEGPIVVEAYQSALRHPEPSVDGWPVGPQRPHPI